MPRDPFASSSTLSLPHSDPALAPLLTALQTTLSSLSALCDLLSPAGHPLAPLLLPASKNLLATGSDARATLTSPSSRTNNNNNNNNSTTTLGRFVPAPPWAEVLPVVRAAGEVARLARGVVVRSPARRGGHHGGGGGGVDKKTEKRARRLAGAMDICALAVRCGVLLGSVGQPTFSSHELHASASSLEAHLTAYFTRKKHLKKSRDGEDSFARVGGKEHKALRWWERALRKGRGRNRDVDECVAVVGRFYQGTVQGGVFLVGGVGGAGGGGGGERRREREWWEEGVEGRVRSRL